MNEKIRTQIAVLNAAWQRYARTADEPLDPATAEALNREYVKAWEGLDACGIAEWMLEYDPETLTFSLKALGEMANDAFATLPMSAVSNRTARSRWRTADSETERRQLI
jgi:hypothetical protein